MQKEEPYLRKIHCFNNVFMLKRHQFFSTYRIPNFTAFSSNNAKQNQILVDPNICRGGFRGGVCTPVGLGQGCKRSVLKLKDG